jgi:beta-lactamase class A
MKISTLNDRLAAPVILACVMLSAGLLISGCAPITETPTSDQSIDLQTVIESRLDGLDAITAIYAKNLPSGSEIAIRADQPMNTLSVIKIPVMVQAFRDQADGRLDLNQRYVVGAADLRRGSGLVQTFQPGLNPALKDLVTQMIITSDNTATDMVIKAIGLDRVNQMLESNGYNSTRLQMTTGDLFREVWVRVDPANASMSDQEVFESGFPSVDGFDAIAFQLEGDADYWLGRTTAREMGRLLEQVYRGELADKDSSAEMINILRQQIYSSRLPQRVQWQGVSGATGRP